MLDTVNDIALSQALYNNEDNRLLGYLGRAPLAPVDDVASRMLATAGYNFLWRDRKARLASLKNLSDKSPILRKVVAGSKWGGQHARTGMARMRDATTRFARGVAATATKAARAARVPRLRITPGDPAALAKTKEVLGPTGKFLGKAAKSVYDAAKFSAEKTLAGARATGSYIGTLNEAAGVGVQALPSVTGGRLHRLAKQAFSKKGAALGFAIQGVSDAGVATSDLISSMRNRSALDSAYTDWDWGDTRKVFARAFWGLLRGLDSALLGLPSMIPGVNVDSDSYHDIDIDVGDKQNELLETVANATSAKVAAEAASRYDKIVMDNLRLGKDADGKQLKTLDRTGNVVDLSAEEGTKQAGLIMAARAAAANERNMMLLGRAPSSIDRESLRDALSKIDKDYNSKAERFNAAYDNYDEWSKHQKGIRAGTTVDQWASAVESNLGKQWARRRANLINTQVYRDMIEENRQDARRLYIENYRGAIPEIEAEQRFKHFWESSSDTFRERYNRNMFVADLMQALKDAQTPQPAGLPVRSTEPTELEQYLQED